MTRPPRGVVAAGWFSGGSQLGVEVRDGLGAAPPLHDPGGQGGVVVEDHAGAAAPAGADPVAGSQGGGHVHLRGNG